MSLRTLDLLRRAADVPGALFTGDEVAGWPRTTVKQLEALDVLHQSGTATCVICDACPNHHVEKVDRITYPGDVVRFFIRCPEAGRVEVSPDRLVQWAFDYGALARYIAGAMKTTGTVENPVADRIWRLGAVRLAGRSRSIFILRGLLWPDAAEALAEVRIRRDAVALIFGSLPSDGLWNGNAPHVMALSNVALLDADGLRVDLDHIESQIVLREETPRRKPVRKRNRRAGTIDKLTRELETHIRSAKKRALDTMKRPNGQEFLPRPTKERLGKMCGVSKSTVTRCFQDNSAKMLQILWTMAGTLDGVLSYKRK